LLPPERLHRMIVRRGIENCAEILALATPGQLAGLADLDLWRAGVPGRDEEFDAARFGVWIEVLAESGASIAAQKVASLDVELVVAGLSHHLRVFDRAAGRRTANVEEADIGGYLLAARRPNSWEAIVDVLTALAEEQPACFHQVMRECRRLSNSTPEIDGLDDLLSDRDQVLFDLSSGREDRREEQGYVTPAHARAFLKMSREPRAAGEAAAKDQGTALSRFVPLEPEKELAFLANTMMAGCSIQARPFTAKEAVDAVVAVCKLGHQKAPSRSLVTAFQIGWRMLYDEVSLYAAKQLIEVLKTLRCGDPETQAALNALRKELRKHWKAGEPWLARESLDVIAILDMPAWAALLGLIDECPVVHAGLGASTTIGTRAVSASDFEFISGSAQIAAVRDFMQSLPAILRT
jgi:hypothetical protein